jgi:hypothetical protein
MVYFLYPYFWSHASRWELKKYLDHPDLMHRTFLKSGSARVVLTIRPGFESDFVTYVETGAIGSSHPYLSIAEEMQAFANTNYPGLPPANPVQTAGPLLYPEQRKAWSDMEVLIQLIEQFSDDKHKRKISSAIPSAGTHKVVLASATPLGISWTPDHLQITGLLGIRPAQLYSFYSGRGNRRHGLQ